MPQFEQQVLSGEIDFGAERPVKTAGRPGTRCAEWLSRYRYKGASCVPRDVAITAYLLAPLDVAPVQHCLVKPTWPWPVPDGVKYMS
jgi:hypothetical protein